MNQSNQHQNPPIRFTLNGAALISSAIARGKVDNPHQVAQRAGISYPTIHGWNKPQNTESPVKISLEALPAFLVYGLGLTQDEVLQMRVGDLFSLINLSEGDNGNGKTE